METESMYAVTFAPAGYATDMLGGVGLDTVSNVRGEENRLHLPSGRLCAGGGGDLLDGRHQPLPEAVERAGLSDPAPGPGRDPSEFIELFWPDDHSANRSTP